MAAPGDSARRIDTITPRAAMYYFRREYFAGWGTLMLLNAGLAQSKGKSGLVWGLLSLFLGPVATLLLVTLYASDKR